MNSKYRDLFFSAMPVNIVIFLISNN